MGSTWQYAVGLSVTTVAAVLVCVVAWMRRRAPGARPLVVLGTGIAVWALSYAIHFIVFEDTQRYFWLRATYLGVVTVPTAFLVFAHQYTSHGQWFKKRTLPLLLLEPVITLVLLWTDAEHHLFFGSHQPESMIMQGGAWFWFNVIYSYSLIFIGIIRLIRAYLHTAHRLRGQAGAILVGAAFPWVADLLAVLGFSPFPGVDLTPFAFIVTCICFITGFSYYRLLDIVPIARDALIENMNDGVIVLDSQNRIVDINHTALDMLGIHDLLVLGESAQVLFKNNPEIFERFRDVISARQELVVGGDSPEYFDLHISPLYDRKRHYSGRLIVARDITERRRIEQAEHEQRLLAETLRDNATRLTQARTFNEILDNLLDNVGQVVNYHLASFTLVDPGGLARTVRSRGYKENGFPEPMINIQVNDLPGIKQMMVTRQAMVAADIQQDGNWNACEEFKMVRSYLGAPLLMKGEFIGFLNLMSLAPNFYQPEDAERLQSFADQAAIAVENIRLLEAAHQRADQASVLLDVGQAVTSGLKMDKLLIALLEQCKRVLPIEAFYIATYDPNTESISFPLFYDNGEISQLQPSLISESPGLTGYVIKSRKLLYIPDIQADETADDYQAIEFGGDPSRSYIGVPLIVGENVVGVISMQCSQPNAYNPDQVRLLETIATQTAGAIENARLFEEIQLHAEEMTALFDIGFTITSGLEMQQVMATLLEKCRQVLPVEAFYIGIYDPATGIIEHPLAFDQNEYIQIPSRNIHETPGLSGQVIKDRKTLYIPDFTLSETGSAAQVFRTSGQSPRSYVGVPMMISDQPMGVISMQSYQPDAFNSRHIRLLEAIANQAAVAIENSRLYEQAQQEIRERSRTEHRYRALFEQSQDAVFIFDLQGRHLEVNARATELLGFSEEELLQMNARDISAQKDDTASMLDRMRRGEKLSLYERTFVKKNGETVTVEMNTELVTDEHGDPIHVQAIARDISERKRIENKMRDANFRLRRQLVEIESLQAQLREQAIRDPLTGLYNRRYLEETLMREFRRAGREKSSLCLVMLDIDGFKAFNDTYGHDAGDLLLRKLGGLLLTEFRASDVSCRYGGEEFIIVMPGTALEKGVERAEQLRQTFLALDIEHFGVKLRATLSIGVATFPLHGATWEAVLQAVDKAAYAAKDAGRNCTRAAGVKLEN